MQKNLKVSEIPSGVATDTRLVGDIWKLAARVDAKPVIRPDYTPTTGHSLASWVVANDLDLCAYWRDLALAAPLGDDDCTFAEFCAVQFDQQQEMDEDLREYIESGDYARDEAAEPSDEVCDE